MVLLTFHASLMLAHLSSCCGVGVSECFESYCLVSSKLARHCCDLYRVSGHARLGSERVREIGGIVLTFDACEGS